MRLAKKILSIALGLVMAVTSIALATVSSSVTYEPVSISTTLTYQDENVDVYTHTTTFEVVVQTDENNNTSSTSVEYSDFTETIRVSKTLAGHNYLSSQGTPHYYQGQRYNY